jgi:NADPH:quinone reductase-like Zn-dependent oxidoreductase
MRAVRFDAYGDLDVLEVREVDDPEPADGQLLVRVRAAGINPGETKIRDGSLHERWPASFPSGQGSDLAGVVERLGPGVSGFAVGDEVIGFTNQRASQAELVVVNQTDLVQRPPSVPWEAGGALFVAGVTAYAMVSAVDVGAEDTVVVAGATGGVGTIAAQLAGLRGARVIGISGPRNAGWLVSQGFIAVDYGGGDLAARLREAAPGGISAMLDCHGGGYVELALELGVPPQRIDTIVDFEAPARHPGVQTAGSREGSSAEVLGRLVELVAAGRLEIPIAVSYPLSEVRTAYAALERDHPLGKVVLVP